MTPWHKAVSIAKNRPKAEVVISSSANSRLELFQLLSAGGNDHGSESQRKILDRKVARGEGDQNEIAGLYILLAAGTNVLPHKFRVNEYKLWMRSLLVLWWLVRLLGLATYGRREEMFDLFCNY